MQPALCPTVATLRRYSHGDLDDGEADTVDRHLAGCDECLAKMDKLSKADTLFGELRERPSSEDTPHALHRAVSASVAQLSADAIAGANVIGGYTLLEEIGRGGMGQVFRASHPRLPVDVAIKLLRHGQDSQLLRRRFESERETLARMDHPNIAKVFDAGLSDDGRPFIAMELVRGTTLGTYLETVQADWRTKLEIFLQIGSAIQHAHQKGVIHRDIKPSNVLLTAPDGIIVPKVIDFGVACAVDSNSTGHTGEGYAVGTLQYMSPEQTENNSGGIDTRTDVYSLGVLLYEMIAGRTPLTALGGHRKPPLEAMRLIREAEPPVATANAELDGAGGRVRQELDWIAHKALEKEPSRRYETVAAFADDIRRLLADEPVEAAPPSRSYRLKKFARRNRAALVGGSLFVLALCAGIVGTAVQLYRARDAEGVANKAVIDANQKLERAEKAEADAVLAAKTTESYAEFLISKFLATARPKGAENGLGVDVTVADALKEAEKSLAETFAGQPKAEAEARLAIGMTWRNLGRPEPSVQNLRRAFELTKAEYGPNAYRTLQAQSEFAFSLHASGRLEKSRALFRDAIDRMAAAYGPKNDMVMKVSSNFAQSLTSRRATAEEGLAIARSTLANAEEKYGEDHDFVHVLRVNVASGLHALGRYDEGLKFSRADVARIRKTLKDDNPMRLRVEYQYAQVLTRTGREKEGVVELERLIPLMKKTLGADHVDTITATSVLCAGYAKDGRAPEAIERGEVNVRLAKAKLGSDHPKTLHAIFVLGLSHIMAKKLDDCRLLTKDFASILESHKPPLSVAVLDASIDFVALCHFTKEYAPAIRHGERVLAVATDDGEPKTAQTLKMLTLAYVQLDKQSDAERVATRYLNAMEKQQPPDGVELANFRYIIAECQLKGKNYESAETFCSAALRALDRSEPDGWMRFVCRSVLGEILTAKGRYPEAEEALLTARKGLGLAYQKSGKDSRLATNYLQSTFRLVKLYEAWGRTDKAAEYRRQLPREKAPPPRTVDPQ